MKNVSILAMLCVAGLATSAAQAQTTRSLGTQTVTSTATGVTLDGATIPAGTYRRYTITADWVTGTGEPWSEEARAVLANQASLTGATIYTRDTYSPRYVTTGGNTFADEVARNGMTWKGQMPLATPYTGGQPLFLFTQQIFGGSIATWNNITVTIQTGSTPTPTLSATAAALTFPSIGSPSAVQTFNTNFNSADGNVKWVKFTVPAGGLSSGNGRYLDIDTEGTTLAPANDPLIVLFSGDGELVYNGTLGAYNDDGGSDFQSQLTFGGATNPRPAVGNGLTYNGRNGALAAGDYYLAVTNTSTDTWTVAIPGFSVFPGTIVGGADTGNVVVNIRTGTATLPAPCVGPRETEPNDTKATAFAVTLADTQTLCGNSTSATGTGNDYYAITVPTAPGEIRQNILSLTSDTPGQLMSLRGRSQAGGVINAASDIAAQNSILLATGQRQILWFTMGNSAAAGARTANVLVTGGAGTDGDYKLTMASTVITPIDSAITVPAGSVTITTEGAAVNTDTDMWILDSNLNAIAGAGCDDTATSAQSTVVVDLATAGTYYVAISNYNLLISEPSTGVDDYQDGNVVDNPGVIANTSTTATSDLTTLIGATGGTPGAVVAAKTQFYDVRFIKFTVEGAVTPGCSPADIAYGDGEPLPPIGQPGGFNPVGPDGGDFDCFFNFYFAPSPDNAVCDIAYGDGEPLPPYGQPGGFNPGVDGGDFDCFFNYYFNGCL